MFKGLPSLAKNLTSLGAFSVLNVSKNQQNKVEDFYMLSGFRVQFQMHCGAKEGTSDSRRLRNLVRQQDFFFQFFQSATVFHLFIYKLHLCNHGLVEPCTVVVSF